MNLMRIITREETVGGLEISDTHIRLAFLAQNNRRKPLHVELIQEVLPVGTISGSKVLAPNVFVSCLKKLMNRSKGVSYVVVSISPHQIYSKILSFPATITGRRLEEAIDLALRFELPLPREQLYVDYEIITSATKHQVYLAACPREISDTYVDLLTKAGVHAVALESHGASLARALTPELKSEHLITTRPYGDGTVVHALHNGFPYFSRYLPSEHFASPESIALEVSRIRDFYDTEQEVTSKHRPLEELTLSTEDLPLSKTEMLESSHFAVWGSFLRGRLPRANDTHVSLLSIGTESAYVYEKALAFAGFLRTLVIGLSVFFLAVYLSAWGFVVSLNNKFLERQATLTVSLVSAEVLAVEDKVHSLNELLSVTAALIAENPRWSGFINTLSTFVDSSITVSSISIDTPQTPIHLNGSAKSRASLNAFKETLLADDTLFSEVALPLTNLQLREDIPFSMSLTLSNPENFFTE